MTITSAPWAPQQAQGAAPALHRASSPRRRGIPSFAGEQMSTRLYTAGIQAALGILLSILGLGSAMGQSVEPDMALGANTQATRDRVISEIRQARADGRINRWSPVLLDVPFNPRQRGARFVPYASQPSKEDDEAFVRRASGAPAADSSIVAPASAE